MRAVVATTFAAFALAFPAYAAAPDYRKLTVVVGKQKVKATLGTYSHPTADGRGDQHTATFPLKTTGVVKVKRGARVDLVFRAGASKVLWRAARIDGAGKEQITADGEARPATRGRFIRWRFRLPKGLRSSSTVLGFSVSYPYAFSSFEVGMKVVRR